MIGVWVSLDHRGSMPSLATPAAIRPYSTSLAESLWQQLYRGNTSGQALVRTALEELRQRLPRLDLLRLDGGFLSARILNLLVEREVHFLTKAGSKLKSIRTLLEQTRPEQWQSYDENTR